MPQSGGRKSDGLRCRPGHTGRFAGHLQPGSPLGFHSFQRENGLAVSPSNLAKADEPGLGGVTASRRPLPKKVHVLELLGGFLMHSEPSTNVLLARWQGGEDIARDRLIARLHPELAQVAAARLRREHNSSLSTGDLINDAVLRLIQVERHEMAERAHFIALASRLMRNILIDHARQKASAKRRHVKVELCTNVDGGQRLDLNELESALIRLGAIDAQLMELVEMRYFGGMTIADVATVTGWSEPTVKRRWAVARAWLTDALEHPIDHD